MTGKNNSAPAFPIAPLVIGGKMWDDRAADGLTKREYAAIHLAAAYIVTNAELNGSTKRDEITISKFAVTTADALIAELEKETTR